MNLPDFPLASWEVPRNSDIPLVAAADVKLRADWRGRKTELLIRAIKFGSEEWLFFREVGSTQVGNWLMSESGEIDQFAELAAEVHESNFFSFAPEDPKRLFHLDGAHYGFAGTHELAVGASWNEWRYQNEKAAFRSPQWPGEFYDLRAAHIGRIMRGELENSDSEYRFALNWLHLDEIGKQGLLFGASQHDLEKLKLLMRCVLYLQNSLPPAITSTDHTWRIAFHAAEKASSKDSLLWHVLESDDIYIDLCSGKSCLEKWGALLFQSFLWSLPVDVRACEKNRPYKWIGVTVSPPTAREKMEATILLREWCEQVGALREFAELVGE